MIIRILKICLISIALVQIVGIVAANAGSRFASSYSCSDAVKTCVSRGTRTIEGFTVTRDCWEWGYVKTCNYPSKNDCGLYEHCYAAGDKGCLLQDSLGNCVNMKKEISCKSWDITNKENQKIRTGFEEKEGKNTLVCKGIPCIDGNCVDKSYETNGEMMDSLSKLYATSNMNPDKDGNFNLFQGSGQSCTKKPIDYNNCCVVSGSGKGWGKNIGAKCTKDELLLMEQREKNLCVYAGKKASKSMGVTTNIKHSFCCFGNLLDKVIQVGGRKQLGRSFGSGGAPDCRGLTLQDIQAIDWNLVDLSEFIEDLKIKFAGKYKAPNAQELASTVELSMDSIRKYDDDPSNQVNNMTGWNGKMRDDSWEADEERRLEAERLEKERLVRLEQERLAKLEQERLAQLERERLEKERLLALERERVAAIERERKKVVEQKVLAKQQEISVAQMNYDRIERENSRIYSIWVNGDQKVRDLWSKQSNDWSNALSDARAKLNKLKQELKALK
jgi:hypothetical protein